MWQPWSKLLERLGRLRIPVGGRRRMRVGNPTGVDARGGEAWRTYLKSHRLYDVWGPHPDSPWLPFHCVPLFAALDRLPRNEVGPADSEEDQDEHRGLRPTGAHPLPREARPGAPRPAWLTDSTLTVLDLPGPRSVEAAAWLITSAGCQPVCTFDNWPHPKGILKPEEILAELLRWATTVAAHREYITLLAPPVWICDVGRLGRTAGKPGQFDNRYYLDDSILPGVGILRKGGIDCVVYATIDSDTRPRIDLEAYFAELTTAGMPIVQVDLTRAGGNPQPYVPPAKPLKTPRKGFRRSAAGGFGTSVPEESSSSGSSG